MKEADQYVCTVSELQIYMQPKLLNVCCLCNVHTHMQP